MTKPLLYLSLFTVLISGCTSTKPDAAFKDVDQTVKARAGEDVRWLRSDAQRAEAAKTVTALLQTNLTAQSAVSIALLTSPVLQEQFEEIGISQAELAQASRLHNPVIMGSWRFPDRPPSLTDTEYSASADFLDLLTLPARKKIAAQKLEQVKLRIANQVLTLSAEVQTAFYALQAGEELCQRLAVIVEAGEAAVDFAQRQYDAGNINELELRNQQAAAAQDHIELMQAEMQKRVDRERLNRLLGLSSGQLNWKAAEQLPELPTQEVSLENLETLAVGQRLDLAAARSERDSVAVALQVKKKTRWIPGAEIGVDSERQTDGQRITGPTLSLELPLFDQGQPGVARLVAEYRQTQAHLADVELGVRSEVRLAQNALVSARGIVEHYRTNLIPQRQAILRETLLHYNAMQKSSYELLFAKEREQTAERGYVEALRDYWAARVELERAVGGKLWGGASTGAKDDSRNKAPDGTEHAEHHHHDK